MEGPMLIPAASAGRLRRLSGERDLSVSIRVLNHLPATYGMFMCSTGPKTLCNACGVKYYRMTKRSRKVGSNGGGMRPSKVRVSGRDHYSTGTLCAFVCGCDRGAI